jgi:hypothetical protein
MLVEVHRGYHAFLKTYFEHLHIQPIQQRVEQGVILSKGKITKYKA